MQSVSEEQDVRQLNLELLLQQLSKKAGEKERRRFVQNILQERLKNDVFLLLAKIFLKIVLRFVVAVA